jgi:anti-sigma factor RsiW
MTQFDGFDHGTEGCAVCEAMLPEAVDGTLSAEEQSAFDRHVASCTHCADELSEAQRGAAWLSMLKSKAPEPPAGLLARILAETSAEAAVAASAAASAAPVAYEPEHAPAWMTGQKKSGGWSMRWAETRMKIGEVFSLSNATMMLQPRLAMTAAMAFFSMALTLNLMGVHVRDMRLADFSTSGLKRTVADAGASATRDIMNMRVVYQMESRVNDLRNDEQH